MLRLLSVVSINTLLCISHIFAAERALVVDPLEAGDFPVGSSNFTINKSALDLLLSQGGDAGQLQQGTNQNGQLRYIDELLAFPDDAFNFQLLVPNNAVLYGKSAGSLVPYAGYVFTQPRKRMTALIIMFLYLPLYLECRMKMNSLYLQTPIQNTHY